MKVAAGCPLLIKGEDLPIEAHGRFEALLQSKDNEGPDLKLRMLDKEGKSVFLRRPRLEIKDEGGKEESKDAREDRHSEWDNTNTMKENGGNECKFRKTVDDISFNG